MASAKCMTAIYSPRLCFACRPSLCLRQKEGKKHIKSSQPSFRLAVETVIHPPVGGADRVSKIYVRH
jgi:hypothetical protein